MSNKQRSGETWPIRVTVTALDAIKEIQEVERTRTGIAPSYLEIASRLAVKEAKRLREAK